MARYRFHCTNGRECVLDAVGNDIRAPHRLARRAEQVARAVMRRLTDEAGSPLDGSDWAEWHVTVHDLRGRRVLIQAFPSPVAPARPARRAEAHPRDGASLGHAA